MEFVEPQLAHRGTGFAKDLLEDPAYVAEEKWDGLRAEIHVVDHRTTWVYSRTGNQLLGDGLTWLYGLTWKVKTAVLDGELCWEGCVSSDVSHRISAGEPVELMLFDVIALGGKSLMERGYLFRRAVVEEVVRTQADPRVKVTRMSQDKRALYSQITVEGGEGIVMKRANAPYRPHSRCKDWVKLHNPKRKKLYTVVITGVTDKATYSRKAFKTGECCHTYGVYIDGVLTTVGQLGFTGPCDVLRQDIGRVAEVEGWFQFRKTGAIRHPQLLRMRDHYDPRECTNEQ